MCNATVSFNNCAKSKLISQVPNNDMFFKYFLNSACQPLDRNPWQASQTWRYGVRRASFQHLCIMVLTWVAPYLQKIRQRSLHASWGSAIHQHLHTSPEGLFKSSIFMCATAACRGAAWYSWHTPIYTGWPMLSARTLIKFIAPDFWRDWRP